MPLLLDKEPCHDRSGRVQEIRAFVAAVRSGSMNRAAAELGISQPSVSQQVEALERALGRRLLERREGGVELLPSGRAFLPYAEVILDQWHQGRREVAFHADPSNGEVHVGTSEPFIATGFLSAAMARIQRQHPRFLVRVTEASAVTLQFDGLRDRSLDVVLSHMPNPGACADIAAEVLFDDSILAVVGEQSVWGRAGTVSLQDLMAGSWILGAPETAIRQLVESAFKAEGLPMPREVASTHSMELRMQRLVEDDHISSLPASLVRAKSQHWGLRALPITFGPPVPVVIASLHRRSHASPVRLFLDHLRAVIAERTAPTVGS